MNPQKPSEIFQIRLRTAREELRKWSQSKLAEQAKLPPSSIAHFETGTRKPSFDTLRRLANALEVSTDYLLGRVELPGMAEAGAGDAQIALTPLSDRGERIAAAVSADLAWVVTDRDRQAGRGYYRDLCFKVNAYAGGEPREIGDGGFTDWTARLTANQKERLLISGLSTDRLAAMAPAGRGG